jgi:hypothetical protein
MPDDRGTIESWNRLCEAAHLDPRIFWHADVVHRRYISSTGYEPAGGLVAVEVLREQVIDVHERMRRRDLDKTVKDWRSNQGGA